METINAGSAVVSRETAALTVNVKDLRKHCADLRAGDRVLLSGTVYTARDAAHKRFFEILDRLDQKSELPFPITDAVIYYAGPTPAAPGAVIGSCGPTTSGRMDAFAPRLLDLGLCGMIGKGERSASVREAVIRNNGVYFAAIGGAGALAAASITSCEVVAFRDLGCESVKRLTFSDFPLIVACDSHGGDIYNR
jgi:fumarate hydratase subunit beta